MNNIKGKRIIVTGSTSGTGKETAAQLSALGVNIVLACRDIERENIVAEGMV